MSSSKPGGAYIFDDAGAEQELARLRALEAVFDPATQELLRATGDWDRKQGLEVGAGAGSIELWMKEQGAARVVAVDINARFLGALAPDVEVVEGDIRELALPAAEFDVVHARYVLIHNREAGAALDALLRCLKPGGWLLLEEPDFGAARAFVGPEPIRAGFERVNRAILATFSSRGLDPRFGTRLPPLLEKRGVAIEALDCDASPERGGSGLAKMMRLSTLQLAEKYIATGLASAADIEGYAAFASNPASWGIYYATFRALARKGVVKD